jgi:hypothetical protein
MFFATQHFALSPEAVVWGESVGTSVQVLEFESLGVHAVAWKLPEYMTKVFPVVVVIPAVVSVVCVPAGAFTLTAWTLAI